MAGMKTKKITTPDGKTHKVVVGSNADKKYSAMLTTKPTTTPKITSTPTVKGKTPTNLNEYFSSKGGALPGDVAGRFADKDFATAAGAAGYNASNYSVNGNNAAANSAILAQLLKGQSPAGGAPPAEETSSLRGTRGIIPDSGISRYKDADSYYDSVYGKGPSYEDILKEENRNVAGILDSIDQIYAGMTARETTKGEGRMGQTRSIQARSGNLGSSFGAGAMNKTGEYNSEVLNAIDQEKQQKVAEVLYGAKKAAQSRLNDELDQRNKKGDAFIAYQKEQHSQFKDQIKTMASTGTRLQDLNDEEYRDLYDAGGFTNELFFESFYNSNLPKEEKADYQFINMGGGKLTRVDKTTGDIKEFSVNIPANWQLKETNDGDMVLFNPATGEYKPAGNTDSNPSSSTGGKQSLSMDLDRGVQLEAAGMDSSDIIDIQNFLNEGLTLEEIIEANPDLSAEAQNLLREFVEDEAESEVEEDGDSDDRSF